MHLNFYGAARAVTGSKHLLTLGNGNRILLDCGLFQGMGAETHELNESFGFKADAVDVLLLSHAHIDHTGLIPKLVKEGFKGKIYCTPATKELTEILLTDSAQIQEHEENIMKGKGHRHAEPLYNTEDVAAAMALFETIEYATEFSPLTGLTVQFLNAGHIIGSACIHITAKENGKTTTLLFSGDIGRYRSTLLQPPAEFPAADYIIMESTYGGALHDVLTSSVDPLLKQIKKHALKRLESSSFLHSALAAHRKCFSH